MAKIKNEIGNRYGKLKVVERVDNDKYGNAKWKCMCDCGKIRITQGTVLRNGHCISCGCANGGSRKRSGLTPLKNHYSSYRSGAKSRDLEYNISLEEFEKITKENCYYCGSSPDRKVYAYHRTRYSQGIETDEYGIFNGVDRIDNDEGYFSSNIVPCCSICNAMKSNMNVKQFKKQIFKIMKNLNL